MKVQKSPEEFAKEYIVYVYSERGLSQNTVQSYSRDIDQYLKWLCENDYKFSKAENLHNYISHLEKAGRAARSIARAVSVLKNMYLFLNMNNYFSVEKSALEIKVRVAKNLPHAVEVEDINRLINVCDPSTAEGIRDIAIVEFLYATGARISEAVNLDIIDVWGKNSVILHGKGGKLRQVPIGSVAQKAITAYIKKGRMQQIEASRLRARKSTGRAVAKGRENVGKTESKGAGGGKGAKDTANTDALFIGKQGKRLSRTAIWNILEKMAKKAGIERISPHTLRHCFATHLIRGGMDIRLVQELLGHADVATTQIYTRVTIDSLQEVYLTTHPRALE